MKRSLLPLLLFLALIAGARAQMPYQTQEPEMAPKKREVFFYGMRAYPFGKIPQGARLDALYQARYKMRPFARGGVSAQAANSWRQLGPLNIGGRVRSIAVHPTDGKTLWIGAADGGVWRSTDRGASWTPMMDGENAITMGAIAVDPTNPNAIYAGTGEMSSNVDAYTGAGIFKSIDGGATWRSVGLAAVGAFSRIVVPPKGSGSLIYAGATKNNRGLYRSTDNGNTWSRRLDIPISDITVDPNSATDVWVGTMGEGVWRSTDRGETFFKSSNGIGETGSALERISVQAAPSNPNILYALSFETDGSGDDEVSHSRIYRSDNRGADWRLVYDGAFDFLNNPGAPQGWYNNVIAIHPTDPNIVVAGGVHLARTTNGGGDWTITNVYFASNAPHADQHAMAFDPTSPDRLYLGNDGGVYRSETAGKSYTKTSDGLAITQFYALALDPVSTERKGYGGTQDNGTVSFASRQLRDGDGFFVAVDHQNPNIVYSERENGTEIKRADLSSNVWTDIMAGIGDDDTAAWSAPLVVDPIDPNILWHGRRSIYTTSTRGEIWLRTDARFKGYVSAIGISPANNEIVYGGSDRGELQVTLDGGLNWLDRSSAPGFPNRAVTDIVPSRTDAATAYLGVSGFYTGHVFKTTDNGATWSDIGKGLPDVPVNALALHPDDEKIIYAGTDIGVFITIDGGETWAPYNDGLPRVVIADLEVHRPSGMLVAATHGRSAWEIPLEKPTLPPAITSPAGGEVWMGGTSQTLSWSGFGDGPVSIEYSLDDGLNWFPLRSSVGGHAFFWSVFDTTVDNARIRVTSAADPNIRATSRSFTITRYERGGVLAATAMTITPYGLAFDGSYLWVTDFSSNRLVKLDPNTLERAGSITMSLENGDSSFTDIAYDPTRNHFFIHKLNNSIDEDPFGVLYEMDHDGKQVGRWISPCRYPTGLAYLAATGTQPERLIVTDRNGQQEIYIFNPADPGAVDMIVGRDKRVRYGPRGATAAPGNEAFYQAITDFTGGGDLKGARAAKIDMSGEEEPGCTFTLASPATSDFINARGLELDPRDSNLWVSDFEGNIYKMVSCDSRAPQPAGVDRAPEIPEGFTLAQNIPNPFSSTTTISFTLPRAMTIALDLFDERGAMVAHMAGGRHEAGSHTITFDASGLPSGVYRYMLTMDGGVGVGRTMVYVR